MCIGMALLLAGLFMCLPAVADLLICPDCGYENATGRTACSHCQALLHAAAPETDAGTVAEEPCSDAQRCAALTTGTFVEEDIAAAVEIMENRGVAARVAGDYRMDIARRFLKNAASLDLLAEPDAERTERMMHLLHQSDEAVRREHVAGTMRDRLYRMGRASRLYSELQQRRKRVPFGGAWIPVQMERSLTVRQAVALRRATVAPCRDCMGMGRVDCKVCKGIGHVPCTNRECRRGSVFLERKGELGSGLIKRSVKCTTCGGSGDLPCGACGSAGAILCDACRGSGERALCRRCSGQGYIDCRRCSLTGLPDHAPCPTCDGEGVVLCTGCKGEGRDR
jgi:hypothetical protein